MKKKIILIAMFSVLFALLLAQSKVYTQKVIAADPAVNIYNVVTNTSSSTSPLYIITADVLEIPDEVLTTVAGNPDGYISKPSNSLRINRLATHVVTVIDYWSFPTRPSPGQTLRMTVKEISTGNALSWDIALTGETMSILSTSKPIPPLEPVAPATHTISGTITSDFHAAQIANVTFTVVSSNPEHETELVYDDGDFTVTVPDGWDGTITPVLAGYTFTPAVGVTGSYTNVEADIEDQDYTLKGNVNPNAPTTAGPANGHIFKIKNGTTRTVQLSWNAPAGVHTPEGYQVQVNGGDWIEKGLLLSHTTGELGVGAHTWKVRAYVNTPKGKVTTPVRASATARSAAVSSAKGNSDEANGNFTIQGFDVVPTIPTVIPTVTPGVNIEVEVTGGAGDVYVNIVEPDDDVYTPTPVPNPAFVPIIERLFVLFEAGPWNFTFTTTSPWGAWRLLPGGAWNAVPNVDGTISFQIPAAKDGEPEYEYKEGNENPLDEPILPVTLSSFTAQLTAQSFVKLTWVTETETNMLGYRIYRGESNVQADAVLVTPIMIEATNTSQTHTYTIEDREVQIGRSYWYWLESVDYINSNFYTPQNVVVTGESTPVLPQVTAMKNAYPNPFKANSNTTIEVAVKEGEAGSVTIYNVLGQAVKTFSVKEGLNPLKWNGRDSKGNICGSGIYFYKLSTPSTNQTKKMVIVK